MKIPPCEYVGERNSYIVHYVKGKKALHLGCTDVNVTERRIASNTHLHHQMHAVARELWGVDIDQAGLTYLRNLGIPNLIHGDVYELSQLEIPRDFDVIVAGELIEHLDNPGLFFTQVRNICAPSTRFLLTTPNCYSIKQFLHCLSGNDQTHHEHVAIYGFATMNRLLENTGFRVTNWSIATVTNQSSRSRILTPVVRPLLQLMPAIGDRLVVECRVAQP